MDTITEDRAAPSVSVAAEAVEEALATQARAVIERLSSLTLAIYPTARKLALFTNDDGDGPPKLTVMYVLDEDGGDLTNECNSELYDSSDEVDGLMEVLTECLPDINELALVPEAVPEDDTPEELPSGAVELWSCPVMWKSR